MPLDAAPTPPQPPPLVPTKTADREFVARGEAIGYDVRVDSTSNLRIPGIEVRDDLPAGFQLIEGSARLIQPGADGRLNTADDQICQRSLQAVYSSSYWP